MGLKEFFSFIKPNISNSDIFNFINESFDSPVEFTFKEAKQGNTKLVQGSFIINNKEFEFFIEILLKESRLGINFVQILNKTKIIEDINNLTKSEVLSVFSTLLVILDKFSEGMKSIEIEASTDKKLAVYKKFANRLKQEGKITDIYYTNTNVIILIKDTLPQMTYKFKDLPLLNKVTKLKKLLN